MWNVRESGEVMSTSPQECSASLLPRVPWDIVISHGVGSGVIAGDESRRVKERLTEVKRIRNAKGNERVRSQQRSLV